MKTTDQQLVTERVRRARGRGRYGESRLAKKVNGVVVGRSKWIKLPSGKTLQINCQKPVDVVNDCFGFESKWLASTPKQLDKWMTQAVSNCPKGLTPVLVVGNREEKVVYYVMTESDWLAWHVGEKKDG